MSGQYWEEYSCGCVSPKSSKKYLLGYCPKHGNDRRALYKGTMPADEATLDIHRRTYQAIRDAALAAKPPTPKPLAPEPQILTTGWPYDKE